MGRQAARTIFTGIRMWTVMLLVAAVVVSVAACSLLEYQGMGEQVGRQT